MSPPIPNPTLQKAEVELHQVTPTQSREHPTGHTREPTTRTLRAGAPVRSPPMLAGAGRQRRRCRSPAPPMPSVLKDRPAGRLGRLIAALRPGRGGPLPVRTGFPTSLADLVVKNHGRLKKPSSSKRKTRSVSPLPSPSPSPSPPPSSQPPPPPAAVSPPAQPRPDLSPVEPVCRSRGGDSGLGLGFLALGGVVSLALLVIWSRKVVAAVIVAAFSLFLLDSVRPSSLTRRPRPAATWKLDFDGCGYVSPIREAEVESELPRPSSSDSDRGTDVSSILAIEEVSETGDDSSKPKAKKRSWKKLIPSKLQRRGRKLKDADSSSGSFRSECSQADAVGGGNAKATDFSDSRRGMRNQEDDKPEAVAKSWDAEVHSRGRAIAIDSSADLTEANDVAGGRFPFVVVISVVLVGLVAGRLPAVVLVVICSACVSSLERLATCRGGDWSWRFPCCRKFDVN